MTVGERYADYDIIREIGRGSMGEVYLVRKLSTNQQIAMKLVRGGPYPEQQERLAVEERGARLQKQIAADDRRVVAVYDIHRNNGDLNVEMEYVDGDDLYTVIRKAPLTPERAATIALQVCQMLDRLGRLPLTVIHGDIKPRNIRLARNGDVKVLDFGIAKELSKARTDTYNPFQSLPYCSPERLNTTYVDSHSDLWSIAVILYEMIAGRRPFQSESDEAERKRIMGPDGADPLPPSCPEPLRNITLKMLSKYPGERYQTAGQLAADLERFLRKQPVLAQPPDDAATRRTLPPRPVAKAAVPAAMGQGSRFAMPRKWRPLVKLGVFGVFMWLAIFLMNGAYRISSEASDLRNRLLTGDVSVSKAWAEYEDLRDRARFKVLLAGVRAVLKRKLIESGDQPILDYRHDQPSAHEGDWSRALTDFKRALELDPQDREVLGKLRLCEGHLLRIRAHTPGRQRPSVNAAVAKFEEAARLMPDSRDPYLGLSRIYFYDLQDVDKGIEMVNLAAKHGQPSGRREKAQMADALRARGIREEQRAHQFTDMPDQERKWLTNARDDFRTSAQAYSDLGDFTSTMPWLLKDTLRRMQTVEQELYEMDHPVQAQ